MQQVVTTHTNKLILKLLSAQGQPCEIEMNKRSMCCEERKKQGRNPSVPKTATSWISVRPL